MIPVDLHVDTKGCNKLVKVATATNKKTNLQMGRKTHGSGWGEGRGGVNREVSGEEDYST